MSLLDAAWNVAAFFAMSMGLGATSALFAKVLWRRELKARPWWRLALWASAGAGLVAAGGLLVFGQDGRMLTYGAMVLAAAASLTWFLWPRR
ncbi:MAG: hypothetical protein ABIR94_02540 [Rubrivivax sp.]